MKFHLLAFEDAQSASVVVSVHSAMLGVVAGTRLARDETVVVLVR
jgi:hypothetical protein